MGGVLVLSFLACFSTTASNDCLKGQISFKNFFDSSPGGWRRSCWDSREVFFFFFLFLAAKENNYVSCELSFPCIFSPPFWCSHILCYMGLLYFKLWSWCVMLFWATRALVNIFFPVCHRGHHWKLCIGPQNTKLAGICSQRPAGWIFFPFSMIAFVLWVMYFLTFLPLFKEIWKTILSSRIKSSFCVTSFLMPSPLVLRILIINL